jgi:hypothetical protein
MLVETEDVWTDDGLSYDWVTRTAWYKGGAMMDSMRVREMGLAGDLLGAHVLRCRAYYNDRDFPEDEWTWDPADDLNVDAWGEGLWGDGLWGDTEVEAPSDLRDAVYELKRRLARQKCSRVSFEFSDQGAPTEGPALTGVSLVLGRKDGLYKGPTRSYA